MSILRKFYYSNFGYWLLNIIFKIKVCDSCERLYKSYNGCLGLCGKCWETHRKFDDLLESEEFQDLIKTANKYFAEEEE